MRIEPDTTRTVFGCLAALSVANGLFFCDLAMTPGSPAWVTDAMGWSLFLFFLFFLLWGLMRVQDYHV